MSDALNTVGIANVSIAGRPTEPVLPDTGLPLLILAVIGGAVVLSLIATYAASYMDPRIYTPDQVLDALDVPMVIAVRKVA